MQRLLQRVAALFVCCLLTELAASAVGEPVNILFIYTDDQSHRSVSCYPEAHDWVSTPNIDALATEGVRFQRAYIGTWCMPSRATMLTGLHPHAIESMRMTGKYPGSTYDPRQCPFWLKHLRTAGYTTAQIGKWHTGDDTGYGRDWDYQAVWNRPGDYTDRKNYYGPQRISFNGAEPRSVDGYTTDNYTDWAVDFITNRSDGQFLPSSRPADQPWFLWLCYGAVHGPSTPAGRHLNAYEDSGTPVPSDIFGPRPNKPPYLLEGSKWRKDAGGNPVGFQEEVRKYNRCVMALDEAVGRLIQALHDTNQIENTLVVFTSDQGFAWGQHGLRSKWAPYDAALLAPLIFSMPSQIPAGQVCTAPVGGVDLIPTFLRFAGVAHPWKMHGHDLSPLLETPNREWNFPVLMSQTNRRYGSDTSPLPTGDDAYHRGLPWYVSLTKGHYKYIRYLASGEGEELYNLDQDPEELENLAGNPESLTVLNQYRSAIIEELRRTDAPFVEELVDSF